MTNEESTSVFAEWAEVTTAHGFFDFSRAKSIIGKIIWLILIFFSLMMMCNQLYSGIKQFRLHEWKTRIQEVPTSIDDGVPFPSIIVCNVNRFKYTYVQEYKMSLDMVRYLFMNLMPFNTYLVPAIMNKTVEQEFIKWRKSNNFTLFDIYDKLGPGSLDLIPGGKNDQQTFTIINTTDYAKCMRIEANINSTKVGSKGGALFSFDTQSWDYLPIFENNYLMEGIVFQVAYDGNAEVGQWIFMYPGTYVSVAMQVVEATVSEGEESVFNPFTYFKSEPPCAHDPKLQFLSQYRPYSENNCAMECSLLIPINLCNCTPIMAINTFRQCEIEEYFSCFGYNESSILPSGAVVAFLSPGLESVVQQCARNCAKPCFDKYIDTSSSHTKLPSDAQADALSTWLVDVGLNQKNIHDIIVLDIYFNTLETYTIEMYESMSVDSLISSSGGLIGLWAGMSFLTIFQAIEYFLIYLAQLRNAHSKTKVPKIHRSQSF